MRVCVRVTMFVNRECGCVGVAISSIFIRPPHIAFSASHSRRVSSSPREWGHSALFAGLQLCVCVYVILFSFHMYACVYTSVCLCWQWRRLFSVRAYIRQSRCHSLCLFGYRSNVDSGAACSLCACRCVVHPSNARWLVPECVGFLSFFAFPVVLSVAVLCVVCVFAYWLVACPCCVSCIYFTSTMCSASPQKIQRRARFDSNPRLHPIFNPIVNSP